MPSSLAHCRRSRALEAAIGAIGAFGIAGPEDDHLGFLQTILDVPCRRHADAHRIAKMMRGAPVPAFPGVRIGRTRVKPIRLAKRISEAEIVTDIAPLMVRGHGNVMAPGP